MNRKRKRLDNLEKSIVTDSEGKRAIFFLTVDASKRDPQPPAPLLGWKHYDHKILRLPGESDKDLQARAIETVKPYLRPGQLPVFFSIQNLIGE